MLTTSCLRKYSGFLWVSWLPGRISYFRVYSTPHLAEITMVAISRDNTPRLRSHITGGSEVSRMGSTIATFTRSLSPTWIQVRVPVMLIQSEQFLASHPTTCLDNKTLRSHLYCEILKSYLFTNSQKCHNDHQHESVCRHLQAKAENKYLFCVE